MKKITLVLIMVLIASLSIVGCSSQDELESESVFTPGTYEGEGNGHAGVIRVAVKTSETKIESIDLLEFNDSEFAVDPANQLIENIIEANSSDVDVITGATITSSGVLEAVSTAISSAYLDGVKPVASEVTETNTGIELENRSTEILVIGAGGAGLTAAIEAATGGAEVIVVEKMPIIGGNTKYATGGLNAAETVSQKEKEIEDSVDLFIEDTMQGGGNLNNPDLVKILAENSAETVDWLIEIGADLSDVGRMGGASVNRTHRPTGGAPVGSHVMDVLHAKALDLGVEILLNSEVVEILSEEGAANGVVISTKDGNYTIESKAVIIATGGFGANNDLVASFDPALKGYGTTNHPGATGDVVEFAKNLNIAYVDMSQIQTHPTVMPSNNYMITEAVRGNGAILVNRDAKRFVNELETRAVVSDAQLAQKGASSYLMFDQSIRESLSAIEGYYNKGFLVEGATLEELAEALEMDPVTLNETIETYNAYVDNGSDEDYNRQDLPQTLSTGPFYAVEVAPAVHHTMGGVMINTNGQVIDEAGNVLQGLYAAGEVTGGIHGNNRLGGNAMADITVFGRIAAQNALSYIR